MDKGRGAGFTLIEMLIALAIVALVVVAVSRTLSTGFLTSGRAGRESKAYEIAENALAFAVGSGAGPVTTTTRLAGGMVRVVTVRIRPDLVTPTAPAALMPYEIDVRVSWREGGGTRAIALSTPRLGSLP